MKAMFGSEEAKLELYTVNGVWNCDCDEKRMVVLKAREDCEKEMSDKAKRKRRG